MDVYPRGFLAHNRPFIVLSGLVTSSSSTEQSHVSPLLDGGVQLVSDLPPVLSETAHQLRDCILDEAGSNDAGDDRIIALSGGRPGLQVTVVGRTYRIPSRKAHYHSILESISLEAGESMTSESLVLHSPISPLTPGSPTFPDGLMTPDWVAKHQHLLPAVYISCYVFTTDASAVSLHRDDDLKNDINHLKQALARASPRARLVAVILADQAGVEVPEITDRLANLRRTTGLDPKTSLFFLPPHATSADVRNFARTVLSSIQPLCAEYYRDLSKHARRKRGRGATPPPTVPPFRGTSQTLPSQGWSVRYDFKLGVFAEFRQEMETAVRHFEAAYDALLGSDVFESIASWSPRWNEARLLADALSIRAIRCLLWNGNTISAVRRWQEHRLRTQDLVDRRGKGSTNYGWEAWNAIWAKVMVDLIGELRLPISQVSDSTRQDQSTAWTAYATSDKAVPVGERLVPWQHLHHAGYWLTLMSKHLRARQRSARAIPEEDRAPPGRSPASQVANKSYLYDTYLCPEPHRECPGPGRDQTNHSQLIVDALSQAMHEFNRRGQKRASDGLRLEIAREHMRCENWPEAMRLLPPLWQKMSWRQEGWWQLVGEVCWALLTCARHAGDASSVVGAAWELMSDHFAPRAEHVYDLANCLGLLEPAVTKPVVILRYGEVVSFVSATYVYKSMELNVGDVMSSQLVVRSRAHPNAVPIRLTQVQILQEGVLPPIFLRHKDSMDGSEASSPEACIQVQLHGNQSNLLSQDGHAPTKPKSFLQGEADLSFRPRQTKVFNLSCSLREAGDVRAKSVILSVVEERFDLDYIIPIQVERQAADWWVSTAAGTLKRHRLNREGTAVMKVLPRPPRMRLRFLDLKAHYYSDEVIAVELEVLNEEDEDAELSVEARILGDLDQIPRLIWPEGSNRLRPPEEKSLPGYHIGRLRPLETTRQALSFTALPHPAEYVLEVKVLYRQRSEPDTPMSKTITAPLSTMAPFDAGYDFSPRVHKAAWPSCFQMSAEIMSSAPAAQGIVQMWALSAPIISLASEELLVEAVELQTLNVDGDVVCSVSKEDEAQSTFPCRVTAREKQTFRFGLEVQKMFIDDRRSAALDMALSVDWKRSTREARWTTTMRTLLPVPRLLVHGGEPRILVEVNYSTTVPGLIHLDYTLENPSLRLITLSMVMDSSDDFAFYGPKVGSLQLVPISRHSVGFNLFPTGRGKWIQPQLKVVDRYFNRSLRVTATEGIRMDKKGILVWVPADDN